MPYCWPQNWRSFFSNTFVKCFRPIMNKDLTRNTITGPFLFISLFWGVWNLGIENDHYKDISQNTYFVYFPIIYERVGQKASVNQKDCFFGNECSICLKLGCKFQFIPCLEIYLRKFINLNHEGTLPGALFLQGFPKISLKGSIWGLKISVRV